MAESGARNGGQKLAIAAPRWRIEARGYVAAVVFVLLAAWVRWLLSPVLGERFPLATLFLAVLFTGVIGEFRHSMTAAALGLAAASYFVFVDGDGHTHSSMSDYAGLALFAIISTAIAIISGRLRKSDVLSRQLAAIVESSDDAIISKNLHSIVQSWNSGAERLFGYTAKEMIGKTIAILIPPDRITEEPAILERISRGERVDHFETVRQRKGGSLVNVSLSISPIYDANGRIIGASKIARDISDRVRLNTERNALLDSERAARAEAERATRLRDEFLGMVSHELRTPLNAIFGWAQLLKRSMSDADSLAEGVQCIEQSARAQAQIIDDLLDMNRIMAGKLHLDVQNVQLATVIEAALQALRPAAEAKSIRIQMTLATNVAPIRGDPIRLQQVAWNLISNAVKFTPKGGKIQILLERINSHIEFSVADNGIGIQSDFLPSVFERFRQADSSASRQQGGLGLGLAIVKQIVELHGGSVIAESAGAGRGTTFHVRLPVSIVRRPESVELEVVQTAENGGIELNGLRLLVIDDDPAGLEVVKRMLEAHACVVTTATSGDAAVSLAAANTFDVVLSDIGMPEMDGYEFIARLRKTSPDTPAIAITAFARPADRVRTLQAGFNMHLAKPIDAAELFTVIQAVVRDRSHRNESSR